MRPRAPYHAAMVRLTRVVRLVVGEGSGADGGDGGSGYAGRPAPAGWPRFYELHVACEGEVGPGTGYLVDIKDVDRAVRERAGPILEREVRERPGGDPAGVLEEMRAAIEGELSRGRGVRVAELTLRLSPYHAMTMDARDETKVLLRERFDFAASHRLHCAELSDEENRRLFGKCNWPSGHGHNYQLEPCVEVELGGGAPRFSLADLERIVGAVILERYDHKHLNLDCEEFGARGVNPTVENIARVFFERLAPEIERGGARLREVTVWETDRTSSTYGWRG